AQPEHPPRLGRVASSAQVKSACDSISVRARGWTEVCLHRSLTFGGPLLRGGALWSPIPLLEHGEWLTEQGRDDDAESLLAEALDIFERLKARPGLERASKSRAQRQSDVV